MMAQSVEQQTIEGVVDGIGAAPDWLRSFLRALRREAIQPKDQRVKSLWDLLRQRRMLGRFPWLKAVLRRIWDKGLAARPRPRTTARAAGLLRSVGILPPRRPFAPPALRPVHAVNVRAAIRARAVPVRPVSRVRAGRV
jgi:hypothetical protein